MQAGGYGHHAIADSYCLNDHALGPRIMEKIVTRLASPLLLTHTLLEINNSFVHMFFGIQ